MQLVGWDLVVRKQELGAREIREAVTDAHAADRELVLRIEAFALTTNTLTYAVAGDTLGYWRFYPTADSDFGRIPAWGYAEVLASGHPDVAVGERLFGYVPMSTHTRMSVTQVRPESLLEASPHRRALPPAYNFYRRLGEAATAISDDEALRAILDPLFFTSFLIDDLIAERGWDVGAGIALSSASSKTALGTAFLLRERKPVARIIGLTSRRNRDFVEQLALYDEVVTYDELSVLGTRAASDLALIDFAGDAALLDRLTSLLGPRLARVLHVGATHAGQGARTSIDPRTPRIDGRETFFAPDRISERSKQWGAAVLHERHDAAWSRFLPYARRVIRLERATGAAALVERYDQLASGSLSPDRGYLIQPG